MNSKTTVIGLVAAFAVLSGAMGLSVTGAFSDLKVAQTTIQATGFLMGHLEIEAFDEDGELIAYRQTDNEVTDSGEQCILKMLFASTNGLTASSASPTVGRGEYASTSEDAIGGCTGILTGAWDVIAIGVGTTSVGTVAAHDLFTGLENECSANDSTVTNDCGVNGDIGLNRAKATSKSWTNGTGATTTNIVLANTFTSTGTASITESGLFNSTTIGSGGMLAHQTFTAVSLTSGDSITVTWTFTVGN